MSRFSTQLFMSLLACAAVLIAPGLGLDATEAPYPSRVIDLGTIPTNPHEGLPPEPYSGYYDYLDYCVAKIPNKCGVVIADALIKKKEANYECCQNLIKMGKDCHDELVKAFASIDEYKSFASIIPQRGSDLWNYCAHLAAGPAPY